MALRSAETPPMIAHGPTLTPSSGTVEPPPPHARLPIHQRPPQPPAPGQPPPRWWWLGCHGGAGVSTLASLIPGGWDAARAWPQPAAPGPWGVLLVCRSHHSGMTAASMAIRQWLSGGLPPVTVWGLVIVADAPGRLPRALSAQRARLAGTVSRTVYVPWVEAWRTGEPHVDTAPKEIARLGRDLQSPAWTQQKGQT